MKEKETDIIRTRRCGPRNSVKENLVQPDLLKSQQIGRKYTFFFFFALKKLTQNSESLLTQFKRAYSLTILVVGLEIWGQLKFWGVFTDAV